MLQPGQKKLSKCIEVVAEVRIETVNNIFRHGPYVSVCQSAHLSPPKRCKRCFNVFRLVPASEKIGTDAVASAESFDGLQITKHCRGDKLRQEGDMRAKGCHPLQLRN